jgi:hypothetical protein
VVSLAAASLAESPTRPRKPVSWGLTKALARDLAPHGIRVNCVAPGPCETDMTSVLQEDPSLRKIVIGKVPLARVGRPEEVAKAIALSQATWHRSSPEQPSTSTAGCSWIEPDGPAYEPGCHHVSLRSSSS